MKTIKIYLSIYKGNSDIMSLYQIYKACWQHKIVIFQVISLHVSQQSYWQKCNMGTSVI